MRRFTSFVTVFLFSASLSAQVAQQNASTPRSARKDPQAVLVLNQAVIVAGGAAALKAIADYTATGSANDYSDSSIQGGITFRALGLNQFRRDISLPRGTRSWATDYGKTITKDENGFIRPILSQVPMSAGGFVLPSLLFLPALNWSQFQLSYEGMVPIDGHSAHDVRLQRISLAKATSALPHPEYRTMDLFVDASTFQVVMLQEVVPRGVIHQLHYSNYALTSGLLIPFSIREDYAGQPNWVIQLKQVVLNTGLDASVFQF